MSSIKRFGFSKKTLLVSIVTIVILAGGMIAFLDYQLNNNGNSENSTSNNVDAPKYETVLPSGKSIDALGGWSRISPPENDPVYAFTDTVNGISVNVSEQPLPQSFKGKVDTEVAEIAKKFNATSTLDANGTKVYIGTSAKGPQSLIFVKNNLLILIKSQQKIDDSTWIEYVTSLN
jgi:hypothetical protein